MLKALLAGWVAIIVGTSILIYLLAPIEYKIYHPNLVMNFLRTIWEIGDAMGPAVKISLIIIFALLVFIFKHKISSNRIASYGLPILFAILSITLVLAFLPSQFSRGYGIGLTGVRFDSDLIYIYIYILGAIFGGLAFSYTFNKLSDQRNELTQTC